MNPGTARALYSAFIAFGEDDLQKVANLTGSEGAFCAGADLVELTAQLKQGPSTGCHFRRRLSTMGSSPH